MRAVNLIPAEQRSGNAVGMGRSGGAAYAVLALFAGVALMALLYGMADHQVSSRHAQVEEMNAKAQRAQSAASQLASYTTFIALRQARTQAVTQLVDSRFDWAHAFHELGRVLPASVSISSLTGTVGASSAGGAAAPAAPAAAAGSTGASASASGSTAASGSTGAAGSTPASATAGGSPVASATPPGSVPTFTITGCADSQKAVAETINRLRLIDGVSEVTLQSSTKSTAGGAGSGSGAGGPGGCPAALPEFNVTVTFQPLPSAPSASTTVVAATGTAAGANTSTGTPR